MTELEKLLTTEFIKIWKVLKATDIELHAYKNAIEALLVDHTEMVKSRDALLVSARRAPVLLEKMNQRYASILGTFVRRFPDTRSAKKALKRIEALEEL